MNVQEKIRPKSSRITADDKILSITLRTLNYGNYGIFLIMGNAGFISSTVSRAYTRHITASQQCLVCLSMSIAASQGVPTAGCFSSIFRVWCVS